MTSHKSVLLKETLGLLPKVKEGKYLDLTLGRAGHSLALAKEVTDIELYGFDLDEVAIKESDELLTSNHIKHHLYHANFAEAASILSDLRFNGIIADLGVSSPQFDTPERGFSYRYEARLDMRMDESNPLSAYTVVNTYSYEELKRILKEYGEEIDASSIARNIIKARESKLIETTFELNDIIKKAKPIKHLIGKGHPSKQTYQALRIEVNHELDSLKKMLKEVPYLLAPKGVLAIISFHSLEDRLVKKAFYDLAIEVGSRTSLEVKEKEFSLLTKKPITSSLEELEINPRAKSAKLRGLERK